MFRRGPRIDELFDAWGHAADEARLALDAWLASHASERRQAYTVYCAALDREQQAADVLSARMLSVR